MSRQPNKILTLSKTRLWLISSHTKATQVWPFPTELSRISSTVGHHGSHSATFELDYCWALRHNAANSVLLSGALWGNSKYLLLGYAGTGFQQSSDLAAGVVFILFFLPFSQPSSRFTVSASLNEQGLHQFCLSNVHASAPHFATAANTNISHLRRGDKTLASWSMHVHTVLRGCCQRMYCIAQVLHIPAPNQLRALFTLHLMLR